MSVGLFVRLEAKPNKVSEVEAFLRKGLELVEEEPDAAAWFGIRLGAKTFGVFDTFADNSGREGESRIADLVTTNDSSVVTSITVTPERSECHETVA
jgi:hypothetical protein